MTNREMRELDAWIAENVMGLPIITDILGTRRIHPNYTTDPAAAMMVLEKCAKRCTVSVFKGIRSKWSAATHDSDDGRLWIEIEKCDTLPLAICLFAKKLFSCNQTS